MNWEAIKELLQNLQTDRVVETLERLKLAELVQEPWFLGTVATLAIVALIMRWRMLLIAVLALAGSTYLLSYTMKQGTDIGGGAGTDTLFLFIAGGVALVAAIIYLMFVKTD